MKRHSKRWMILTILIAGSVFGLARLYYNLTDDFHLGNITYNEMPYHRKKEMVPPNDLELNQLKAILDQKFYYIDKGAQSYAFKSENDQYVLKFFKFKHLKPHWFIEALPSIPPFNHFKEHTRIRKKRKLDGVFEGYETAFEYNKEGSQLVYLHLLPTDYINKSTVVIDKLGREHLIEMDQIVFLIQKKGEPLRDRLKFALNQGDIQAAQNDLSLILNMYVDEYRKGIYDRDHGVLQNTGMIHSQPFHLDVGKISKNEQMKEKDYFKNDLELVIWKIDLWLKSNYPDYYPSMSKFLAAEYLRITGDLLDLSYMTPEIAKSRRQR
jgi:hypothetical protein